MSGLCDVVVVGGGPGGYVAAIRAAQLGASVTLVERDVLGGVCLNWGCIPTKALLRAADIARLAREAGQFGVGVSVGEVDCGRLVARSREVAGRLSKGVSYLLRKNGVTVISDEVTGVSAVDGGWRVGTVGGADISGRRVIVATGASARALPGIGLVPDGGRIWTAREAMTPESLPVSVIVVGSGAIGIEFASMYVDLGVEVTVIEVQDGILPGEDVEISALAQKAFEARGIRFHTSATIGGVVSEDSWVEVTAEPDICVRADAVIVAVGIVGNGEKMGLEELGVVVERGHVRVDEFGATGVEGLYAIGDVTGRPWLAHKASHQAVSCVEGFLSGGEGFEAAWIPSCVYSHPQLASIGLTESAARAGSDEISVGRFGLSANGKALALGEGEGVVKTVFESGTGRILGAHIIGAEATELIGVFALAMSSELTEEDLMRTIFPHPTVSEALHESVLEAFGRAIHI